ncbi:uncharacterized protein BDZ99DRAFT_552631 [Mytilinidion resinicola]|uniref:Uncharacterized protein n=1 Tax=Mytilinidion resinicola TaxID=574789 RepID=A0A6A6XYJ5_9PEZI|nr:uncharacterized protein BDZ99DRAFT_552631 [Mytilinidion resinicola]KAF2801636.1 hypothetical protein BDZ99DRAFT_552631 [Mytilinidion resinicola]
MTEPDDTAVPANAGELDTAADNVQPGEETGIPSNDPQSKDETLPGDDSDSDDSFLDERDLQMTPGSSQTVSQEGSSEAMNAEAMNELQEYVSNIAPDTFTSPFPEDTNLDDSAATLNAVISQDPTSMTSEDESQQPDPANRNWWQEAGHHDNPRGLLINKMLLFPDKYIPEGPIPSDAYWERLKDPVGFDRRRAEAEPLSLEELQSWEEVFDPTKLSSWEARDRGGSASPPSPAPCDSGQLIQQQPVLPSSPSSQGHSSEGENESTPSSPVAPSPGGLAASPTPGSENAENIGTNEEPQGQAQLDTVDGMTSQEANDYLNRVQWRPDSNNGLPGTRIEAAAVATRIRAALVDTSQAFDLKSNNGRRWAPGSTQLHRVGCFVWTWPWTPRQNNLEIRGRTLDFTEKLDRICHLISIQKGICTKVLEGQHHIMKEIIADPKCRENKLRRYKDNNDDHRAREHTRLIAVQQGPSGAGSATNPSTGVVVPTGTAPVLNNQPMATIQPQVDLQKQGALARSQIPNGTQSTSPTQNAPLPSISQRTVPPMNTIPPPTQQSNTNLVSRGPAEQQQGQGRPTSQQGSMLQRINLNNRNGAPYDGFQISASNQVRHQERVRGHVDGESQRAPQTYTALSPQQRLQRNVLLAQQRVQELSQQRSQSQQSIPSQPANASISPPPPPGSKRLRDQAAGPSSQPRCKTPKVGRGSSPSPHGELRATVAHPRKAPTPNAPTTNAPPTIVISGSEDDVLVVRSQPRQPPRATGTAPTAALPLNRPPTPPPQKNYSWVKPATQMVGWKPRRRQPVLSDRAQARAEAARRQREEGQRDDAAVVSLEDGETGGEGAWEASDGSEGGGRRIDCVPNGDLDVRRDEAGVTGTVQEEDVGDQRPEDEDEEEEEEEQWETVI